MAEGVLFGVKLYWWILAGIVIGLLAGAVLHATLYATLDDQATAAVLAEAYPDVGGGGYTLGQIEAQRKAIGSRTNDLLERTFVGGLIGFLADGFLKLLRAIVVPLVFLSLAAGVIGLGDPSRLGRLGARTLAWYVTTSLLALLTGLVIVNVMRPGADPGEALAAAVSSTAGEASAAAGLLEQTPDGLFAVLLDMLPGNVVADAAGGNLFGVIVAAIALGVATLFVTAAHRATVSRGIDALVRGRDERDAVRAGAGADRDRGA